MSFLRRTVLAAALIGAAALAACQPKAAAPGPAEGLYVLGKADAPLTLIEYASVTCSHCKNFHDDVLPMLKTDFIDAGKVRYEFRPMRSAPINLSTAAFSSASAFCSSSKCNCSNRPIRSTLSPRLPKASA
jgi:protein-disulfide isomerase